MAIRPGSTVVLRRTVVVPIGTHASVTLARGARVVVHAVDRGSVRVLTGDDRAPIVYVRASNVVEARLR